MRTLRGGGGGGVREGGLWKALDKRKDWGFWKIVGLGGGLPKFEYFKTNRRGGGGLLKNWTTSEGGLLKFSISLSLPLIPPCHIKWTFPDVAHNEVEHIIVKHSKFNNTQQYKTKTVFCTNAVIRQPVTTFLL